MLDAFEAIYLEVIVKTVAQRPINVGLLLAAMMLLAFVMLWPTLHMGLWLDELCSVNDVAYSNVQAVIANMWGRMDDLHPPLSYIPLFACIKLFGLSDLVVRTPPVIFGLLLIPTVYWLGKLAHSRWVGLLAAFFATVSPFANYYDCQSRGYSMAAWLTALCLISFIKLVDVNKARPTLPFIGVLVTTAALCYTEYVCVFILPALGLATIWICLRLRSDRATAHLVMPLFIRCAAALTLGFLLFVPWIPSMLIQSASMRDLHELSPAFYWPLIFSFNLMNMFPTPLIISIPLYCLGILGFVLGIFIKRRKLSHPKKMFLSMPSAYATLICCVVIPSSLVGFLTPWFIGYYRYIYPYTAAGWVLFAILLYKLLGYAPVWAPTSGTKYGTGHGVNQVFKANLQNDSEAPLLATDDVSSVADLKGSVTPSDRRRNLTLTAILSMMVGLNILYLCWFDSKPQSGLRTMARDAQSGEYDNSLVLIVPDVIAPTLGYYLTPKDREAHHILIAGYPRWSDPFTPIPISDLKKLWGPEIVREAAAQIDALPDQGLKYLVIAKDSDKQIEELSTKTVPRMTRVKGLLDLVNKKYKKISERSYAGVTENVTIFTYQLPPIRKH